MSFLTKVGSCAAVAINTYELHCAKIEKAGIAKVKAMGTTVKASYVATREEKVVIKPVMPTVKATCEMVVPASKKAVVKTREQLSAASMVLIVVLFNIFGVIYLLWRNRQDNKLAKTEEAIAKAMAKAEADADALEVINESVANILR